MRGIKTAELFGINLLGLVLGIIVYEVYSRKMGHPGAGPPGGSVG